MSAADVKPHLERIIKELITRDMAWHGFLEAGDNGFLQSPAVETNPGEPPGMVPPPGGPTGTYLIAAGWESYCGRSEVNPATDVYAHWREEITSLFSEWWSIPSQSEVEGVARSLRAPLGYTALEPGAEGDYRMEFDENAPLISAFENGGPTLALLQGQAMNAFRTQYWGHLQRVTVRYHLAIRMLTVLVIAEAELWKNAWKDLAQLADDAAYALENKESVSSPFDTIATIAKVAGMFPGPQKGAVSIVGTVSGLLHGLIESGQHEARERKFTFHDDPAACVQEIRDALKDLRDDIRSQEQSLKRQADQIVAELGEPEYLLHRPAGDGGTPGILDTTDPDDVLPERTRIMIEPTTMDYLAEDVLGEIAVGLRKAGYSMDLTGTGWSFHRNNGIGLGSTGPYESFSALNDAIAARLEENANIVDQVAEVVLVVKKTFTETDDQVSQDLAALDN